MEFVCPNPNIWDEIYKRLYSFYCENKNITNTKPPVPLILTGWVYSTDYHKKIRWEETVSWAKNNGCSNLIPSLADSEKYMVDKVEPTLIQEKDPYGFDEEQSGMKDANE